MLIAVLSGFILALAAPGVHKVTRSATGWIAGLLPLALLLYFGSFLGNIAGHQVIQESVAWVPSLGINLDFRLDGLSMVFALLITGVGTMVMIYAGGYLAGNQDLGRFYAYLLAFMAAMLGIVLVDNLIILYIFWELTSITSYLLIGFKHEEEKSRKAALQALLVTASGGLAMLGGLILMGLIGGSLQISELLARGEIIRQHGLYLPALLLILIGAFTKSAQFPFHFWLPGAMEAPAPVSAYLHSATMVKAGIYLLARLTPALGGTEAWQILVMGIGGTTMVLGALIALHQTDIKRILAYSTVSSLGTLAFLLGIGGEIAVTAAMVFLVVHSLYKGTLFLVGGSIDHETGTRDITQLGGLRSVMPLTAAAAVLAALSMAGLPPLFGFLGKELIYEATLEAHNAPAFLTAAAVIGNAIMVTVAALLIARPFLGPLRQTPRHPHAPPWSMRLGPLVLGGMGLLLGLTVLLYDLHITPEILGAQFFTPVVSAVMGEDIEPLKLALWHGLTPMLLLSGLTIALGAAGYFQWERLRRVFAQFDPGPAFGPARLYAMGLDGLLAFAGWMTSIVQNGYLRFYLTVIGMTTVGLIAFTLVTHGDVVGPAGLGELQFYELAIAFVILIGTAAAIQARSRLMAVASLGVVGFSVSLLYVIFGAPDLGMTQFSVETLIVILFVLVLYRLPRFETYSTNRARLRDGLVSLAVGGVMTTLVLTVTATPPASRLAPYFTESAVPLAKGHNIVNVILADYRGIDTLGEITVLSVAAVGVFALLKLRPAPQDDEKDVHEEEQL